MTFMNNNANIKQFKLIKFLNENCNDDHVISRISIVLRRDKLEAPYYMNTKIRLSSCLDNGEKGLIHAMNILNHSRMYNLTEDRYDEIQSMIIDTFEDNQSEHPRTMSFLFSVSEIEVTDIECRCSFDSQVSAVEVIT